MIPNQQQELRLKCLQEAILSSVLAPFFVRFSVIMRPAGRQRPGASALISDSVCAEDDSANLESTESANCVCLDSNA